MARQVITSCEGDEQLVNWLPGELVGSWAMRLATPVLTTAVWAPAAAATPAAGPGGACVIRVARSGGEVAPRELDPERDAEDEVERHVSITQ